MVLLGLATLVWSLVTLAAQAPLVWVQTAVGAAVAMLAGIFPVRVPRSKNSFAAGEIFIFLLLLIHGLEAAAMAAASEAAVSSWRTSKRWRNRIASPAMAALAMLLAGALLNLVLEHVAANAANAPDAGILVAATMLFALGYFVLKTWLVTAVPRLKRNQRLQWSDLFAVFGSIGIAYAGSAAVAALLYLTYRQSGVGVLMAMVPLLAMLLATLHYFFRQQKADQAMRLAGAEAAEREREIGVRHVRELEASERRFHSAFMQASIGMTLLGFEGHILQANPVPCALFGNSAEALTRRRVQDLVMHDNRLTLQRQLGLVNAQGYEGFALELRYPHPSGEPVWAAAHCKFSPSPAPARLA